MDGKGNALFPCYYLLSTRIPESPGCLLPQPVIQTSKNEHIPLSCGNPFAHGSELVSDQPLHTWFQEAPLEGF